MANLTQDAEQIIRPAVDLGPYIGAVLIGSFISLGLWGASLVHLVSFHSFMLALRCSLDANVRRSD